MLEKGGTLILPNPSPSSQKEHLYFIISDPNEDGRVLLVNLTTYQPGKDKTCILNEGEHPFINHKSTIEYSEVLEPKIADLEKAIDSGIARTHAIASDVLLEKIQDGAKSSPALPKKYRSYFSHF